MKTLKENVLENINFDKIARNEHFIYVDGAFEFFAIKVSEDYAVFIMRTENLSAPKRLKIAYQ